MRKPILLMFVALCFTFLGSQSAGCQEKITVTKQEADSPSTITDETLSLLRSLRQSGRTGTYIVTITLIVVIITATWMIFLQRQSLARFESQLQLIETNIKSQELVQKGLETQHSVVIATNDELRAELKRVKQSQDSLKQSVKDTIDTGIEDIVRRLQHISVSDIVEQIPEKFREDVQKELVEAAEQVAGRFRAQLKDIDSTQIAEEIRRGVYRGMETLGHGGPFAALPEWDYFAQTLAERIAYIFRERYGWPR